MATPFAAIEDLRKHWPDLPAELEEVATTKLEEGSIIVRGLYPDIDARLASGALSADVVRLVVCQMVATVIKREIQGEGEPIGESVSQQSFTSGPFTQNISFRVREAELFLSRLHKLLLGGGGARNRKAFMIIPGR